MQNKQLCYSYFNNTFIKGLISLIVNIVYFVHNCWTVMLILLKYFFKKFQNKLEVDWDCFSEPLGLLTYNDLISIFTSCRLTGDAVHCDRHMT